MTKIPARVFMTTVRNLRNTAAATSRVEKTQGRENLSGTLKGRHSRHFLHSSTWVTYDVVKRKLLQWYDDMKETRKKRNKLSFTNARYNSSKSMFIFSNRLEKLFKLAYAFRRVEDSRTLRERYVAAVPKPFRRILTSQILSYKIKEKVVTCRILQKGRVVRLRKRERRFV
jgi:hypothetical protein